MGKQSGVDIALDEVSTFYHNIGPDILVPGQGMEIFTHTTGMSAMLGPHHCHAISD